MVQISQEYFRANSAEVVRLSREGTVEIVDSEGKIVVKLSAPQTRLPVPLEDGEILELRRMAARMSRRIEELTTDLARVQEILGS